MVNNSALQKLHISHRDEFSTFSDDYRFEFDTVLSRVLWDKSSISNTYSFNHTLYKVAFRPLSKVCQQILKMNRNENKVEVALQKILLQHFAAGNTNIHDVFANMPETRLPFAIEWIGRNNDGRTLMYDFVQAFPTLFDIRPKAGLSKQKH